MVLTMFSLVCKNKEAMPVKEHHNRPAASTIRLAAMILLFRE
jgi:hypothetical protein